MPILEDPPETDHGTPGAPDLVNSNNATNATNNTNDATNNGTYSTNNIDIDPNDPNDPGDLGGDDPGMDIDDPAGSTNLVDQLAAGDLAFVAMPDPVSFKEAISRDDWQQ